MDATNYGADHSASLSDDGDTEQRAGWMIIVAQDAMRRLQKCGHLEPALKKLRALQMGQWTDSTAKAVDTKGNNSVPIYQIRVLDHLRVVWHVDVAYSDVFRSDVQVIKVWDVCDHAGVKQILPRICAILASYSSERVERCRLRDRDKQQRTFVRPHVFTTAETESPSPVEPRKPAAFIRADEQDALVAMKFIPLSEEIIACLEQGWEDAEFPFQLSRAEHAVLDCPKSVLLLGRSGTGKTTCIIFKLYSFYKKYHSTAQGPLFWGARPPLAAASKSDFESAQSHAHQLFVTVSPVLCNRVRRYFLRLKATLEHCSDAEAMRLATAEASVDKEALHTVIEEEDEEKIFADIPTCFADLTEDHFPLFLTYAKLLCMLEGDLEGKEFDDDSRSSEGGGDESGAVLPSPGRAFRGREVTYDMFEKIYWPHMDQRKTKNNDPSLVWAEITALIKGSEEALATKAGFLSEEEYCTLSTRCFATFKHNRPQLYALFQQYEMLKKRRGHHDAMDRIHRVYRALTLRGYTGVPIHEVYSDEVQDLTIAQAKLLLLLCNNPIGFFFAGDTAQTIARGSAFTFEEVSSMFYRHYAKQAEKRRAAAGQGLLPEIMQLTDNYRSHSGILRLASSVVDLIEHFFKGSIDHLERDKALVDGPRPIFLSQDSSASLSVHLFGSGSCDDNIEFGAEQVILVRDQAGKEEVQKRVKTGLVMTIYEAKGMEFNDVLLFNFFQDSPAGNKWRVVLDAIPGGANEQYPPFDLVKHNLLNSELKHLYTAVTRARKQLWFFDSSIEQRSPMLCYWEAHNLVQVVSGVKDSVHFQALAKKSSPEEWLRQGKVHFERRSYDHALFCFKKCGMAEMVRLCEANLERNRAKRLLDRGEVSAAKKAFQTASGMFLALERPTAAAKCLMDAELYGQAGEVYLKARETAAAVEAFTKAGLYDRAGACWEDVNEYDNAVLCYKKGRLLELAVTKLQREDYRENVDPRLTQTVAKLAASQLTRLRRKAPTEVKKKELAEKEDQALALFTSSEDRLQFLQDHGMVDKLVELHCLEGRFSTAGAMLRSHGRYNEAAKHFLTAAAQASGNIKAQEEASQAAGECWLASMKEGIVRAMKAYAEKEGQQRVMPNDEGVVGEADIAWGDGQASSSYAAVAGRGVQEEATRSEGFLPVGRYEDEEVRKITQEAGDRLAEVATAGMGASPGSEHAMQEMRVLIGWLLRDANALLAAAEKAAEIAAKTGSSGDWTATELQARLAFCQLCLAGYAEDVGITQLLHSVARADDLIRCMLQGRRGVSVNSKQSAMRKACESFLGVRQHATVSTLRIIVEGPTNRELVSLILANRAQARAAGLPRSPEAIITLPDDAPEWSKVHWWRVEDEEVEKGMSEALVAGFHPIIAAAVEFGRNAEELKEPCLRRSLMGHCDRDSCPFRHVNRITRVNQLEYLRLLGQQCSLASKALFYTLRLKKNEPSSRFWLERMAEQLRFLSPLVSSAAATEEVTAGDVAQGRQLAGPLQELISGTWLSRECGPLDAGTVLRAAVLLHQMDSGLEEVLRRFFGRTLHVAPGNAAPPGWSLTQPHQARPVHWELLNMVTSARLGQHRKFIDRGVKYLSGLLDDSLGFAFETSVDLIWFLEAVAAVACAGLHRGHGFLVGSHTVRSFLQRHKLLLKDTWAKRHRPRVTFYRTALRKIGQLCKATELRISQGQVANLPSDVIMLSQLRLSGLLVLCGVHIGHKYREADDLLHFLERMKVSGSVPEPSFERFVRAGDWEELAFAFQDLCSNSLEPLVVLKRAEVRRSPSWFAEGVTKTVRVHDDGSIDSLDALNPVAQPFVPSSVLLAAEKEESSESERPIEDENEERERLAAEAAAEIVAGEEADKRLAKEEEAVAVIQKWWRQLSREQLRRATSARHVSKEGLPCRGQDSHFDALFSEACSAAATWKDAARRDNKGRFALLETEGVLHNAIRYIVYYLGRAVPTLHALRESQRRLDELIRRLKAHSVQDDIDQDVLEEELERRDLLEDAMGQVNEALESLSPDAEEHCTLDRDWLETEHQKGQSVCEQVDQQLRTVPSNPNKQKGSTKKKQKKKQKSSKR